MSYLGMAIGSLAGLFVVYFGSDRVSESMAKKHGVQSPEVNFLSRTYLTVVPPYFVLLGPISHANRSVDLRMECGRENPLVLLSLAERLILGSFQSWGRLFLVSVQLSYLYDPSSPFVDR